MERIISKSKYLAGLQCLKYLWYLVNDPETIPPYDEAAMFRFQQGHEVGNLAKSLFPDGIEMEHGIDIEAELARARELTGLINAAPQESPLFTRRTLFEPAFTYKNSFARADILKPAPDNSWDIIEVKSASAIKDINIHDISFQKYCYEGAGLKINKCFLMYLNKEYIRYGPVDARQLLVAEDVTVQAEMLQSSVEENIARMLAAIECKSCPEISIGKICDNPYECQLKSVCWSHLPQYNVFELYRGKDLACYYYQEGITMISQINQISMLNSIQLRQYQSVKNNCPVIDKDEISLFLEKLKYPLYLLDFETFATAIPLFDGLKPYQNIPFQFSCHIIQSPDDEPENLYFLAEDDGNDPRTGFLQNLKKALGYSDGKTPLGSILVYYEYFEKGILKALAEQFSQHGQWIEDAIARVVDLYEPFGKFYYYSPMQKGSASLKNVLPALTGISYDDMEIKNGQEASVRYLNITFFKGETPPDEDFIKKIRKDLLDYCGLDTEGMIYILRELYRIIE